jgi:putative transposase
MPQSLAKIILHIVYSTKHRQPFLKEKSIREELYSYLAVVLEGIDSPSIIIGGVADHIHIACLLSRKLSISQLVEEAKTSISKWIKTKGESYRDFYWQGGYGAFSVSESKLPELRRYIENQEQHHRTMSFQDEFRELCRLHGVPIDERYVWD